MGKSEVFLDTSGFYALLVKSDPFHPQAKEWMSKAARVQQRLLTSDYILDETATLLKARGLVHQLSPLFELIAESHALRIEWTEKDYFEKARIYFLKYQDQNFSFTDCVSFIVMHEFKITEVLTKDLDFRIAGFSPILID